MSWDPDAKTATCESCHAGSLVEAEPQAPQPEIYRGVAGASARREYERRSERELARKEKVVAADKAWREQVRTDHPVLGRVATALTPKPVVAPESQSTRAWDAGAAGEERVGAMLDATPGIVVLHDRRVPKSRANIDHIVVGPSGVFIVDPKRYAGSVEARNVGGWLRPDFRLYVNGRNRTKLVEGILWQAQIVRGVLDDETMPVRPMLCFDGSLWPRFFATPLDIGGVTVAWPAKAVEIVGAAGPLTAHAIRAVAATLAASLRPA